MTAFGLGASAAHQRLRARTALVAPALALLAVTVSALVERHAEPSAAADVTLGGAAFGVCLPLVAYAIVARASRYGRLDDGVRHLSRHGASRRSAILGVIVRTALQASVVGALIGLVAVTAASGRLATAFFADALASAWIGAIAGASYAAWLSFGSLFGKAGGGRLLALVLDFAVGAGSSALACPWPRAHVRSLAGGELLLGMPPWQSGVALLALAVGYPLLCSLRVAR